MEENNYHCIAAFEKDNWWYRARRHLLGRILASLRTPFQAALDAGCGVGSNFEVLARHAKSVVGIDGSEHAVAYCETKGYHALHAVPIHAHSPDRTYDLILCADVLEHIHDDRTVVAHVSSLLSDDGILIVTVPAHRCLWNDNDVFSHHVRRYEYTELKELLARNDLTILRFSYWNTALYLPSRVYYTILRLFRKREVRNNLTRIPSPMNRLLYAVLWVETFLFQRFNLSNGVSLVAVCRKKAVR